MKLAVRAKALGKKLTLMTTAFVLAVSSLTALTPFVLAEKASAVGGETLYVNTAGTNTGACTAITPCQTIQYAVTQADNGDTVRVAAGIYTGNVTITKDITLVGNNLDAKINGRVDIKASAAGATLRSFTITATGEQYSVGVFADGVTVSNNTLFGTSHLTASAKAIYAGDNDIDGLVITNNVIRAVTSPKGAYGILINKKNFTNLQITNNHIKTLTGLWTHAIGLEGNTPGAVVTNNHISGLAVTGGSDLHPVFFENNSGASSVTLGGDYNGLPLTNNQSVVHVDKAWASAVVGSVVLSSDNVYRVVGQNAFATLSDALNNVTVGGTVVVDSNLTVTSQVTIDNAVVLEGNGYTLSSDFTKTSNSNNAALGIQADDVTVHNLTVDGFAGTNLHGINVYEAQNVKLNQVAVNNNTNSGLVVGKDAEVTVTDIHTANNGWHGINVDKANATLTVLGASAHAEAGKPHIFVDHRSDTSVKVNDPGKLYVRWWAGDGYKYLLDESKPTVVTTLNKALNPTQLKVTASDDQRLNRVDVSIYKANNTDRISIWGDWTTFVSGEWDYSSHLAGLADGDYLVRATVSDLLGKSTNAVNVPFTVDHTAPVATITTPGDGDVVSGNVTITGVVADENPMNSYFKVTGPDGVVKTTSKFTDGRTTHTFNWNTTGLEDGVYEIQFETRDEAQNKEAESVTVVNVVVDNTPITVEATTFTIVGNVITPNVVVGEAPASQSWTQVSGPVGGVTISDPTALTPSFTVLQDGAYEFELTVVDASGNSSTGLFAFSYTTPVAPATNTGNNDGDDSGDDAPVTGGFNGPAFISPATTDQLGANDEANTDGTPAVEGTSTEKNLAAAVNNTDGNAFGLAWYWWLLIVAGLATILWWIIAAARRRQEEN